MLIGNWYCGSLCLLPSHGWTFPTQSKVEFFGASASVQLSDAKCSHHRFHFQRLLARDTLRVQALRTLCQGLALGEKLVPFSAVKLRSLWHRAVCRFFELWLAFAALQLASPAFRRGTSLEQLLLRGAGLPSGPPGSTSMKLCSNLRPVNSTPSATSKLAWARHRLPSTFGLWLWRDAWKVGGFRCRPLWKHRADGRFALVL